MTKEEVKKVLQSPYKPLVLAALSYPVNLKDREMDVLILRYMRGYTQEEAAEEIFVSVKSLQRFEHSGIEKCRKAWSNLLFVKEILKLD